MAWAEAVPSLPNLQGWWKMSSTSSTELDASGHGHLATYAGGVTHGRPSLIPSAPDDESIYLNGSTGQLTVSGLDTPAAQMVGAWIQTTDTRNVEVPIWSNRDLTIPTGPPFFNMFCFGVKGGKLFINGGGVGIKQSSRDVCDGLLHFVCFTHTGSVCSLYIDGILDSSFGTTLAPTVPTTFTHYIGADPWNNLYWFGGSLDDVVYYSDTKSDADIYYLYTQGLQVPTTAEEDDCVTFGNEPWLRHAPRELTSYVTPDGVEFFLTAPRSSFILSEEGLGTPPIEWVTQRGPFQHGDTPIAYYLRPRTIQIVVRQNFSSRQAYWEGRSAFMDIFRPNRMDRFLVQRAAGAERSASSGVPAPSFSLSGATNPMGKYRKYMPNGAIRQIDAALLEGPNFVPNDNSEWDMWGFTETIRLQAFNPIWYDPEQHQNTYSSSDSELTFPITFPIDFSHFNSIDTIEYLGTWREYPTIQLRGPMSGFEITNESTNEHIALSYVIPAGGFVYITLQYGRKIVEVNDGTSFTDITSYVTPDSDLATFHLAPNPEVVDGRNVITLSASGTDPDSRVYILWNDRYYGL